MTWCGLAATVLPVYLNDMYRLDLNKMEWEKFSGSDVLGTFPSARMGMGMVEINEKIVFYGGFSATGMSPFQLFLHF